VQQQQGGLSPVAIWVLAVVLSLLGFATGVGATVFLLRRLLATADVTLTNRIEELRAAGRDGGEGGGHRPYRAAPWPWSPTDDAFGMVPFLPVDTSSPTSTVYLSSASLDLHSLSSSSSVSKPCADTQQQPEATADTVRIRLFPVQSVAFKNSNMSF
jgi:hypothetical protein